MITRRSIRPVLDDDIVNDPSLLTMYSSVREVLEPFDGLVGDVIGSDQFITSPNRDKLFEVPMDDRREVILRRDGRYGPDDPFLWPQLYHPDTFHLSCVQAKVKNPKDPAFILWCTPKNSDFVVDDRGTASGVGLVSEDFRAKLLAQVKDVYVYYQTVEKNPLLYGSKDTNRDWVASMVSELHQSYYRLNKLTASLQDATIMVANVQRRCLELRAYIVFMTEIPL
ncbi:hypothetical protein ONZ45_g11544 [Pleurotus djamor]|nr:hypothetical protein ONZ45_g11544 [Pleurotus djamor]